MMTNIKVQTKITNRFRVYRRTLANKIAELRFGRSKPTFIIIGAQKSGTTALYSYLSYHPDLLAPHRKEINHFNCSLSFLKGEKEYHRKFPILRNKTSYKKKIKSFDDSPNYMLDAKEVAYNISQYDTNIKILVLLRDPVSRAFSAWNMYRKYWQNDRDWYMKEKWVKWGSDKNRNLIRRSASFGHDFTNDINEEVELIDKGYRIEMPIVEYGFYKEQLEFFYKLFKRENIMIIESEDFKKKTRDILYEIENFIGVEHYTWPREILVPHFVGDYKRNIPTKIEHKLKNLYINRNMGLDDMIGRSLTWFEEID